MIARRPRWHWVPLAGLLMAQLPSPPVAAEPEADAPPDVGELCRRVFDAVDEPEITFGLQGYALRPSSRAGLDRIVDFARNCPWESIVIVGHSDSIGDEAVNRAVSRRRAQAVADYLLRAGVPADRLEVEGRGSAEPVADNETISGRARNRRVELKLRDRD